jgi:hypothetical protein
MVGLLGDEGFVDALKNAENLVGDVEDTLRRVEEVEDEANEAVQEANQALHAVDARLKKVDDTISLIEVKIEAGFSLGFFFFAFSQWSEGNFVLAAALGFMGLLGASSLIRTILNMPQVRRLRDMGDYATDQIWDEDWDRGTEAPLHDSIDEKR